MTRPHGLSICLVLVLCLAGSRSQFAPPNTGILSVTLYIKDMNFDTKTDLVNRDSQIYTEMKNVIQEHFSSLGGQLEDVIFSDGGGCVKVYITWRDGNGQALISVMQRLNTEGISIWDETWMISTSECSPEVHSLVFKLYVVGMPWKENFTMKSTPDYQEIKQLVETTFSDLGGEMTTLELTRLNGCVEFYIEWNANNPTDILMKMSEVMAKGVMYEGQTYQAKSKPCLPSADECPAVSGGTFGICLEHCNDADEAMKCPEGFKCCSNGCGHTCVRVGYAMKLDSRVVLDFPWVDGVNMDNTDASEMRKSIQEAMKMKIVETFNTGASQTILDVEILKSGPYSYMNQLVTAIDLVVYFTEDIANNDLMDGAKMLESTVLNVNSQSMRIIAVHYGSDGKCNDKECHGICKGTLSGQYCSCSTGFMGLDCSIFDCRKDLSLLPTVDNNLCVNGGKCGYDEEERKFQCSCPRGYYGSYCEVLACDLLDNPCNNQGKCVGDFGDGRICECDSGRGGLFCESSSEDNLTSCERVRRLMQFVHSEVGNSSSRPFMKFTMKEMLQKLGDDEYSVPYCWPKDVSPHSGGYHSLCVYDTKTGIQKECYCLNLKGDPNSYQYFGEGDCRVSSGDEFTEREFYIHDLKWSDDLLNEESELYMTVKTKISEVVKRLKASVMRLSFKKNTGCVSVYVYFLEMNDEMLKDVVRALHENGIMINNEKLIVSEEPCPSGFDVNLCPPMRNGPPVGLLGLCGRMCQNEENSCPSGQLCCSNSCGGTQCMEVGYFHKLRANITVALYYDDGLQDTESQTYQSMKEGLEPVIHAMMLQLNYTGYKATKILGFFPSSPIGTRNTVIAVEMWFTEKLPVASMFEFKRSLMQNGFDYESEKYDILEVQLGEKGPCPRMKCSDDSICVTRIGGMQECACPGTCQTSGETQFLQFTLYVVSFSWMEEFRNKSSMPYMELKRVVQQMFYTLGGDMITMEVAQSNGCLEIYVQWSATNPQGILPLMTQLRAIGFTYKGENFLLSDKPCLSMNDLDSCPPITTDRLEGSVGLCAATCTNDSCSEGQKCCPTACGGTSCMEVGYLQKMTANIIVNVTFSSGLSNEMSAEFQSMKNSLEENIHQMMMALRIQGYKSTKVLGFKPSTVGLDRRMSASQMNTVILLEMKFTEVIPVKDMFDLASELLAKGFQYGGTFWTVYDLQYGDKGPCPRDVCSKNSICVTRIGGARHCACPETRTGYTCELKNCMVNGEDMCQNSGECLYANMGEMICNCPIGYYGEFCEAKMCDLMTKDACNSGSCVGDLNGWVLCDCPRGRGGLFCEENEEDREMTECLEHRRVTSYALSVINGSVPNNKMTIPMSEFLHIIDDEMTLAVPNCRPNDGQNPGMYHSYCTYHKDNGTRHICFCTSTKGDPNYWYYDYKTDMCQVYSGDICETSPCMNDGKCHSMHDGRDYHCECITGYEGTNCERIAGTECPVGVPLMADARVRQCRTSPCPQGFECHADPADRWTACCVKPNFLCEYSPCQGGGRCVGSLLNHTICTCPTGRSGPFCEKTDDVKQKVCQMKQDLNSWLINVLKNGDSRLNMSSSQLLTVLVHMGMETIPDEICDDQGNFKHTAYGVKVRSVNADKSRICLDSHGNWDPSCKLATCDKMELDGGNRLCKNDAKCVGDIGDRLCDCRGTGYHGVLCELLGERSSTECQRSQDIANFIIGIFNGSVDASPGNQLLSAKMKEILDLQYSTTVFVPSCDSYGDFEFKGCTHDIKDPAMKKCHCATEDGEMVGDKVNLFSPPDNCMNLDGDGSKDCPSEWGPSCVRPHWWCSATVQCDSTRETCSFTCKGRDCSHGRDIDCIPTTWTTPCDPQPCELNDGMKCPRCGQHGQCFNMDWSSMGDDSRDMDDESSSEESSLEKMDYTCMCDVGHSGHHCEVVDEICNTIPEGFCSSKCIGDLGAGILCGCSRGMGGVLCDRPVHTTCERRKALFDDAIAILKDEMTIPGYDQKGLKELVKNLIRLEKGETIPLLNCTENGSYHKVQCQVDMDDLEDKECYCVDYMGMPISSNVKPYIGYDVCTGTFDHRPSASLLCGIEGICYNGGRCIYNPYEGRICDCPTGFYGQFCQYSGSDNDEPKSMCDFLADMYDLYKEMKMGNFSWAGSQLEKDLIFNITNSFVAPLMQGSMVFKAECEDDGNFKPATCLYNMRTGERGKCYCWNYRGPDPTREVEGPDSEKCYAMPELYCNELSRCVGLECKYGYRRNQDLCPVCECRDPCENVVCGTNERCTMQLAKRCREVRGKCSEQEAVCVSTNKLGVCPGFTTTFGSIIGGGLTFTSDTTCRDMCRDDADCEGKKKCCGLCGTKCMEPLESSTCEKERMKMEKQKDLIIKARSLRNTTKSEREFVQRAADLLWHPECDANGFLYKPLQCMINVDDWDSDNPAKFACHCVDLLGSKIKGANPNPNDPTSCNQKPGTCPMLEPSDDSDSQVQCSSDLSCVSNEKCCSNGNGQVCAEPVHTEELTTTLDQLLMNACEIDSDICKKHDPPIVSTCTSLETSGTLHSFCRDYDCTVFGFEECKITSTCFYNAQCVDKWDTEGKICECQPSFKGPFCERSRSSSEPSETPCKRKLYALGIFMEQFKMAETNPTGIAELYRTNIEKKMRESDYMYDENELMNAVDYKCTSDGMFNSTQCIRDLRTWNFTHCYCVQENGKEIPGTRMSVMDGWPFCGKPSMTCPVGQPLKSDSGEIMMCHNRSSCPEGYSCQLGSYGNHYCCPTKTTTAGVCPSSPIQIMAKDHCDDRCNDDEDCMSSFKCCKSTCGKTCVPAIDNSPSDYMCPMGMPLSAKDGRQCSNSNPCHQGYYCKQGSTQDGGICCLDYSNVNLCTVPPNMMERCSKGSMRYFYNSTSKMCEKFMESGCQREFNNFASIEECCSSCNDEGRCRMGTCPAIKPGVVATCQEECSADRHCPDKLICCSNGCGKTCVIPEVENKTSCFMRQLEARRARSFKLENDPEDNDCDGIHYIPRCEHDGTWAIEQCKPAVGLCWCVTPKGYYIPETMTRRIQPCVGLSDLRVKQAETLMLSVPNEGYEVCPQNDDVKCCPENLCQKKCSAHPEAICRINPCGTCKAEFFNAYQEEVDCDEGLSKCEGELKEVALAIQELRFTGKKNMDDMDDESMYEDKTEMRPRTIRTDIPLQCQLPSQMGVCRGFLRQWYFDPVTNKCDMFIWGMCGGNQNRFRSPEECYASCRVDSPCSVKECSIEQVCKLEYEQDCYMESEGCDVRAVCVEREPIRLVRDIFVPQCLSSGEYKNKQCHGQYCWCVNDQGEYQENSLSTYQPDKLECTAEGVAEGSTATAEGCPNNKNLNVHCMRACKDQVCPGKPDATCRVDLCSDDCDTKFVDINGDEVECGTDECEVFSFDEVKQTKCAADLPCDGKGIRNCPDSICETATSQNCSKNPCALCMVDPCTCEPYFVDVNSKERLSHDQCNFLSVALCEVKKCSVLTQLEKASFNNIDLEESDTALPDCDSNGKFKSEQCMGSNCHCVDAFGKPIEKNADGTCQEIDPVKEVRATFTFEVDYSKLKQEGKLEQFKKQILDKLVAMGIDPDIIQIGEPYQGSTKIDIIFKEKAGSPNKDLAAVKNIVEQSVKTGDMAVDIDGNTVSAVETGSTVSPVTASQIEIEKKKKDDDDGLDDTEKIIIGVVCGGVGLLIIIVIVYFACCRQKKKEHSVDDNYDHIREGKSSTYDKAAPPVYNQAFEDEGHYMKVRL